MAFPFRFRHAYPFFGHQELPFSILLLDVVVLHFHLMGELQPLLQRLWRGPAAPGLQLLLCFPQRHAHLWHMTTIRCINTYNDTTRNWSFQSNQNARLVCWLLLKMDHFDKLDASDAHWLNYCKSFAFIWTTVHDLLTCSWIIKGTTTTYWWTSDERSYWCKEYIHIKNVYLLFVHLPKHRNNYYYMGNEFKYFSLNLHNNETLKKDFHFICKDDNNIFVNPV